MIVVPQQVVPVLQLCDGTRDSGAMRAKLIVEYGMDVDQAALDAFLNTLDEALLLDNERFTQERVRALEEYRSAPHRTPSHSGEAYPSHPAELRRMLDGYLSAAEDIESDSIGGHGLLSPHIDYMRGGPVYARVWKRAAGMVREADLAVILGTDHYGGEDLITLTYQSYATPYGVLPTPREAVDALAEAIGVEAALAGELHHRSEHSIELAAVWLHHIRQGQPIDVLPILCGSFQAFVEDEADLESATAIQGLLETMAEVTKTRKAIFIAAGDLAHVGPAFGDQPLDLRGRARLKQSDDELIALMCAGDAHGFFQAIKRVRDRNKVCGASPIYLALRMMGDVHGEPVAYDRCTADENNTSFVSISGIVFKQR
jgi:AmmeMemoRadiSam system protein B